MMPLTTVIGLEVGVLWHQHSKSDDPTLRTGSLLFLSYFTELLKGQCNNETSKKTPPIKLWTFVLGRIVT